VGFMKNAATAALAPLAAAITTGQFRSALRQRPVTRDGSAVPWYTQPAIDFLCRLDYSSDAVLEFGAGYSTIWWGTNAKAVLSVEDNRQWYDEVTARLPSNVNLRFAATLPEYLVPDVTDTYDVVVVDGSHRAKCTRRALELVANDGLVIIDNSEGHWGDEGTYPIIETMAAAGWSRIDFYGLAPGAFWRGCTSLFFRSASLHRLMELPPPDRPPRRLRA